MFCFYKNQYVLLENANLSIQTHALQYAIACFGGIRGYYNPKEDNIYLFRLEDHFKRLHRSAKRMQLKLDFSIPELINITIEILKKSKCKHNVYIRPFVYKSGLELSPRLHEYEDNFFMYAISLNDYLDVKNGLNTMVSSYRRIADFQMPLDIKSTGSYLNSAFAKTEAMQNGYDEAIFLDIHGNVSEGSAENIFLVKNQTLYTPDANSSILPGITRKTIIEIAKEHGIGTVETKINRTDLYTCDELFFTGTGVQVAWIKSVDKQSIGNGKIGKITQKLQEEYFRIVYNKNAHYKKWLTPVY